MNKVRKTSLGRTGNDTGYILSFSPSLYSLRPVCKWQRCRGKLTLLKYEFHPFILLQKTPNQGCTYGPGARLMTLEWPHRSRRQVFIGQSDSIYWTLCNSIRSFLLSLSKCGWELHLEMVMKGMSAFSVTTDGLLLWIHAVWFLALLDGSLIMYNIDGYVKKNKVSAIF